MPTTRPNRGFTLVELLVTISILVFLIAILLPGLHKARLQARSTVCKTRLKSLGDGIAMYTDDNEGVMLPGRMPKVDSEEWSIFIEGGKKYRPTFLAMLGSYVGLPPFEKPIPVQGIQIPPFERGDRQNYTNDAFICPDVPEWVDERNGCYGYNYHFLGNGRLRDSGDIMSFKNWPVKISLVKAPGDCVAVADSMGTAAAFREISRGEYQDDDVQHSDSGKSPDALGNEGFNLDPPKLLTPDQGGEIAERGVPARSAPHERHLKQCNVLWLDAHVTGETLKTLGYAVDPEGIVLNEGESNRFFHLRREDLPWTMPVVP